MSQSSRRNTRGFARREAGFVAALAAVALLGGGVSLAQIHLGQQQDDPQASVGLPQNEPFCSGNPCPNQTCDEVNQTCVGNVTLQAPMGAPIIGLRFEQLVRFDLGRTAFDHDLSIPEGLGPIFNQTGCGSCHITPLGGAGTIVVNRFGVLDFDTGAFDPLSELGGSLQQTQAIAPECEETIPFPPANTFAQRLTNSTLGFGFVEQLSDAQLLFNELNPPSPDVSGRARLVNPIESPAETRVGRFGWKAPVATVLSFSGDAALNEMGLTNRLVPNENAPNGDTVLLASCDPTPDPEDIPDALGVEFIDRVTDFQRFLAPPPQTPRSGLAGEQIFEEIGCADCHLSSFTTPPADDEDEDGEVFANTTIHPYSDFLVHDMGFAGDFIGDGPVGFSELRTAPLWGMRLRDPLWHDGRVAGGTLAFRIQFPGGIIDQHNAEFSEARTSAQAFLALSPADQDKVVAFLDSLGRREFDMDGDGDVDFFDQSAVQDCFEIGGVVGPDDGCAIADPNQDGVVDTIDLALLDVVLGVPDDEGGDEGDDEGDSPLDDQDALAQGAAEMDFHISPNSNGGPNGANAASSEPERKGGARERAVRRSHRGL